MKQELVQKQKLPDGWKIEPLSEVVLVFDSGSRPKGGVIHIKEGIPSISAEQMNNQGKFYFKNIKYIPHEFYKTLGKGIINKYDTLIVKDGATTGKTCFIDDEFPFKEAAINEHVFLVRPNDKIDPKLLFYIIFSDFGQKQIKKSFHGGTIGGITKSLLNDFFVVYPEDKKIQQQIVAKLDAQMAQIEIMKKEAEKEKAAGEEMKSSYVESTLSQEYQEVKLEELILFVKSGISREFSPTNIGVPIMRSTNILLKDSKIDLTDIRYWYWNDPQGDDINKYLLEQGDILLNFINSPAQIGKVCVYKSNFKDCIYTTNTFRIKFNQNKLLHQFFRLFSLTVYYRRQIEATTKKAVNQASFTQNDLKEIKINLPDINEQKKIVKEFDIIEIEVEIIQNFVNNKLSAISQLPSSILNDVFGKYEIPNEVN